MKKLVSFLLMFSLLLSLLPGAYAAEGTSGSVGSLTWTLSADGTLTVSGTGAIPDYAKGEAQPWKSQRDCVKKLIIGSGVTRIGDRAFQTCKKMESAVIPDSVTSIGQYAFQNCYVLASVNIAPSVQLSTGAFRAAPAEGDILAAQTTPYMNSKYYKNLSTVKQTGIPRVDVINIALSQLGYHEGNSTADYAGGNAEGNGNFVEYGRSVGSVGSDWCSEFAHWCVRMAGISTKVLNVSRSANADSFTKNTTSKYYTWDQTIYGGGSYTPQKGDLLLWAWNHDTHSPDEALSHTSLLDDVENRGDGTLVFHSIDGNLSGRVKRKDYVMRSADGTLTEKEGRLYYIVSPDYKRSDVQSYRISFRADGKTVGEKTVGEGGWYGALPIPESTGKTFLGWYTKETGGELVNIYTPVRLSGDQTLYARWEDGAAVKAKESRETITLNGSKVTLPTFQLFDANGGGTNYVRLRDIADLLDGTNAQFDVSWNGKVVIVPHTAYASRNGTEGVSPFAGDQPYKKLGDSVLVGSEEKTLDGIVLTDSSGGGHTYFKLRDLGAVCGFAVDWQQGVGIIINT